MAMLLTSDLLERYARALEKAAPQVAAQLRPGLDDSEIDDLVSELPFQMPAEARRWWRWRRTEDVVWLLCGHHVNLDTAVEVWQRHQTMAQEAARMHEPPLAPAALWSPTWLTFLYPGGMPEMVMDCTGPGDECPILWHGWDEGLIEGKVPAFGSLGDFIAAETEGLEAGWTFHDGNRWVLTDRAFADRMHQYIPPWDVERYIDA